MIVVDASTVVQALVDEGDASERAWAVLKADPNWSSVPHLHAEVFSGIRGQLLGRKLTRARADRSILDLTALHIGLVDIKLLLHRMWELRDDLSGYDAAYVAAAEALGCPLVTADARLAAAPGVRCEVRLVA